MNPLTPRVLALAVVALSISLVGAAGCVNVRPPDIQIGTGPPPEDVDASRVPPTATHEEARAELEKAYRQLRYLEDRVRRLEADNRELEAERDEYEDKYDRLKDKYED